MKKILYIEDNKDISEAVKIILNNAGFITEIASSGKEGLKLAETGFDLYLLDIMLPDMSGWDIFEQLKNKNIGSKFAFLSAIPISLERTEELKSSGISDYITKPFTKNDLLKRVRKMFSKKILYVEDNQDTANAVRILLDNAGFHIDIAYSGKEALEKSIEYFDLILLDMMLPDMSGWDIFEKLKEKIGGKLAFLTSVDADLKRIEELKKYGVADYIKKPFSKDELIKKIHFIVMET